jgi:leucyl aminopeptidase
MSRGGYNGGSTIIRPGSDWLTYGRSKKRRAAEARARKKEQLLKRWKNRNEKRSQEISLLSEQIAVLKMLSGDPPEAMTPEQTEDIASRIKVSEKQLARLRSGLRQSLRNRPR